MHHSARRAVTAVSHRQHSDVVGLSTRQISYGAGGVAGVTVEYRPSVAHCHHMERLGIGVAGPRHDHGTVGTLRINNHVLGWTGG